MVLSRLRSIWYPVIALPPLLGAVQARSISFPACAVAVKFVVCAGTSVASALSTLDGGLAPNALSALTL